MPNSSGSAYLTGCVHVVRYPVLLEGGHGPIVWFFSDVVRAYSDHQKLGRWRDGLGVDLPVPHESMFDINPLYGACFASD